MRGIHLVGPVLLMCSCAPRRPPPPPAYPPPQTAYAPQAQWQQPPPGYTQPAAYPPTAPAPQAQPPVAPPPTPVPPPIPPPAVPPAPKLEMVTVNVHGVIIGAGKTNRKPWDCAPLGCSSQDAAAVGQAAQGIGKLLMAVEPTTAIALQVGGALAPLAGRGLSPDPFGSATIYTGGKWQQKKALKKIQDTFEPQWESVSWRVPLDNSTRIQIFLTDKDAVNDDPIGTVIIGTKDIRKALEKEGIHVIDARSTSGGTVTLAQISAAPG